MDHFNIEGSAFLVPEDKVIASGWASKHISYHPYVRWVVSRVMESDEANLNKHYWSIEDLEKSVHTFNNTPMNVDHQSDVISGFWKAAEVVYPSLSGVKPFVEIVGAMWTMGPQRREFAGKVQEYFDQGALKTSMECYAESVTCHGTDSACGETFDFKGPTHPSYCQHMNHGSSFVKFNNPCFIGAALVLPPHTAGNPKAYVSTVNLDDYELAPASAVVDESDDAVSEWQKSMWSVQMSRFMKAQ